MNDTTENNQPPLTDREKAAGYRVRLTAALERVCGIMDEAARDGFEVNFGISNELPIKIVKMDLKLKL
jgi:hypothetical protein